MIYVLAAAALAVAGIAVVRRPHPRLLALMVFLLVTGLAVSLVGLSVHGTAALGYFYWGIIATLVGLVGSIVLVAAELRSRGGAGPLPPI